MDVDKDGSTNIFDPVTDYKKAYVNTQENWFVYRDTYWVITFECTQIYT